MTDSAKARAFEAIAESFKNCGGVWSPGKDRWARDVLAGWALEALTSDLLVDLALEAGGLEHCGAVRATKRQFAPTNPDLHFAGPVYRRKEKTE